MDCTSDTLSLLEVEREKPTASVEKRFISIESVELLSLSLVLFFSHDRRRREREEEAARVPRTRLSTLCHQHFLS